MATSWITGVCVQQNRLEWTVLRRVKEAWEISGRGSTALPESVTGASGISAAALKPHLRQFKGRVSVALPTGRVLLRVALLPSTDATELRGMAELQTDKFSPFPIETVASGGEVLDASGTSSLVAMAVVRREDVEAVGHAFQEAGALPDVVDVEALGWWWGLKQGGRVPAHGSQIYLRVAFGSLDMVAVRDGAPLLFRSLPVPPAAKSANMDHDGWLGECAEEVADSLTALETEWGGGGALTLHIFHAAEAVVDWAEPLCQAIGLEALFRHPLEEQPSASEGVARRLAEPARLLAMDLAPETWRAADVARRIRRRLLRSTTIFLAAWLLALGVFWTLLVVQRGRLARLRTQVEAMEGPAKEIRRLRAKTQEFSQYANRTYSALECLRVFSESLPQGMDLTSFVYRKGSTISLRGEADSPDKVYGFIQALEQTALFPEVKSEGISTRNTPQGSRSQFGVTIRLPGIGEGES
jgi:Tfp pilus assembly protein PilN